MSTETGSLPSTSKVSKTNDLTEERKSASSSVGAKAKDLPQPPAKPKAGRSLLATDDGDDVELLVSTDEDDNVDLLEGKGKAKKKGPRMSFSMRFFGDKNKQKNQVRPGRGSFMGFLLPKNAKNTYDSANGREDGERLDSVVWRRKESKEMTKSLQMDMDIYQYLKERSPSFEEEVAKEDAKPKAVSAPAHKGKGKGKKNKKNKKDKKDKNMPEIRSNLLVSTGEGGGARQDTRAPQAEKKRGGVFGRIGRLFRKKNGQPGFASRVMSRMSFRQSSYNATQADDLRVLLEEKEKRDAQAKKEEEEEDMLFRPDSAETDLSVDLDENIDSSLLVSDDDKQLEEVDEDGRISKVFHEDEEPATPKRAKKKGSFLGTEMTKTTQALPVVKATGDRKSNEMIRQEADASRLEKAFTLSNPSLSPTNQNI